MPDEPTALPKPIAEQMKKLIEGSNAANKAGLIRKTAQYILRGWIAQTPGASPEFATDKADAAMAVATTYVQACEAMVAKE